MKITYFYRLRKFVAKFDKLSLTINTDKTEHIGVEDVSKDTVQGWIHINICGAKFQITELVEQH